MRRLALPCSIAVCLFTLAARAQEPSARKAALLSFAVPGLGHRYVTGDHWGATGSAFITAEIGLWLGFASTEWQRRHTRQSYRSIATSRAGADIAEKNRRFFLLLGDYRSSESYVEDLLVRRRWDQLTYANDAANQWKWASDADWQTYQRLRAQSDTWSRRRTLVISSLVANRLLAALSSVLSARRGRSGSPVSISASTLGVHVVWAI